MKKFFITGTDTNCGKTYVTRKLLEANPHSIALKPVASGCIWHNDTLISEDAQQLQIRDDIPLETINPWRFERAVSPHLAASLEQKRISVRELVHYCLSFEHPDCDTLYVEGAGGLFVPLNEKETWIDFLKLSKIPVILVVGMKLGCINHSFLTQTALATYGIECVGWIANQIDTNMDMFEENVLTLKTGLSFPLIQIMPYSPVS